MGNFESLGLVLSAVKDSRCLRLKKTNGTWFIMPPLRRGGAGALSGDRVCRASVCVMLRTSALTRKPKGLGRRNFAQGYRRSHVDCAVPKGSKRHFIIFTGETKT